MAVAQDATRPQPGTLPPDDNSQEASRVTPGALQPAPVPAPLSVAGKFRYRFRHTVDPWEFMRASASAALEQWRGYPEQWGQGWDAYGVRVGSSFGQHLVQEQIMFAVEAVDHEDPRRPRTSSATLKGRIAEAIKYTFVARSDSGKMMPAYSRFIGAYGGAFVSRYGWYPAEFHTVRNAVDVGTTALAIDAGMNVLRELFHHYW